MKDVTTRQPRTHVPKSLAAYRTLLRLRPRVLAILTSRPSAVTASMAPASPPDDVRELRRGSVPGEGGAVVVHQGLHGRKHEEGSSRAPRHGYGTTAPVPCWSCLSGGHDTGCGMLTSGNYLNGGSARGRAWGFKLASLPAVSHVGGWHDLPQTKQPLLYLVTLPLKLLPASALPFAMNGLAAVFGALTLALLVRSVALLPHDRTKEQRQREQSEHSLLSIGLNWMPPLFGALVCGFQLSFWQHSTSGTGEILNLLF